MRRDVISGIRPRFQGLSQSEGQVAHVLLTRSPLIQPASWSSPFDLHVLSTPPAFVLSQNQTLRQCLTPPGPKTRQQTLRTVQTDQDSASIKDPPPTGWTADPHLNHQPTRQHQAGHMASTTWHTVEFSRNRRASPQDLAILGERLVVSPCVSRSGLHHSTPSPGRSEPPCRAALDHRSWARPCRGRTKHLRSDRGCSPAGPATSRSLRIRLRVRSSLPGDLENITRMSRRTPNPWSRDAAHRARSVL